MVSPADSGYTDAVSIAADPRDDAGKKVSSSGMIDAAEAQRVQRSNGPRAHGKDIAQNAAHSRRCSLIRFNERRMIVAFHLENCREPVADINGAGILARTLNKDRKSVV